MLHKVTQLIAPLPRRDVPAAELAAGKHRGGTPAAPARCGEPSAVRPAGQRGQPGTEPEPAPLRTAPGSSAGLPWPLPASLLPTLPFLSEKTNKQSAPVPFPPAAGGGMRFAVTAAPTVPAYPAPAGPGIAPLDARLAPSP